MELGILSIPRLPDVKPPCLTSPENIGFRGFLFAQENKFGQLWGKSATSVRLDGFGYNYTLVQPTILCSTVDQVGSRLFFRGYGLSDRMKPIHAGLLGSDFLLLLDEAHLLEPFRQTLASMSSLCGPDGSPFGSALLTATPAASKGRILSLSADDRVHPVLSQRIRASKPARLVEIPYGQRIGPVVRCRCSKVYTARNPVDGDCGRGNLVIK